MTLYRNETTCGQMYESVLVVISTLCGGDASPVVVSTAATDIREIL